MKQVIKIVKHLYKIFSVIYFRILNPRIRFVYLADCFIRNVKIFNGKGNFLKLGNNVSIKRCRFRFLGEKNLVEIHSYAHLRDVTFWLEGSGNHIIIGKGTTTHGNLQLAACEGTTIIIGDDCMFSHDIYIRTSDSHPVVNTQNNRINPAKNITIGSHVWLGMQCLILKGANIPDGCVIGARSTVTSRQFNANSLIVGSPAASIKEGIEWHRKIQ